MPMPSIAIICGNYVNAYSIVQSLCALGWPGRIACLKACGAGPVLTELLGKHVETWETDFSSPADLIAFLQQELPPDQPKVVFFTDERFHQAFRCEAESPQLSNTRFFVGSTSHLGTILDRHAFYLFLEEHQLAQVPRTVPGDADPWLALSDCFLLRLKQSWNGMQKLPRVEVISTRRQLQQSIAALKAAGLREQDWCFQELLSVSPRHNVSVCGWHDRQSPIHLATRKVLQHPANTGNGDVCELLEPMPELVETAARVLDALEYSGPFELEFALDTKTNTYKVIELNPRFWMQHALVGAVTGEELVRRYVGLDLAAPAPRAAKYWVNTVYTVFRLLRGDARVLRYLAGRAEKIPSWSVTMHWLPRYAAAWARRVAGRKSRG